MAALLTQAGLSESGSVALSASAKVIVSGDFAGGAMVRFTLEADSLRPAKVVDVTAPSGFVVDAASGQTLAAEVVKGGPTASIDVSVI